MKLFDMVMDAFEGMTEHAETTAVANLYSCNNDLF